MQKSHKGLSFSAAVAWEADIRAFVDGLGATKILQIVINFIKTPLYFTCGGFAGAFLGAGGETEASNSGNNGNS